MHRVTAWDGFGNLTQRDDQANGSTETAAYDALIRLIGSTTTLTGGASLTRSYSHDAIGNRSAYAYSADGEMTRDGGRTLA